MKLLNKHFHFIEVRLFCRSVVLFIVVWLKFTAYEVYAFRFVAEFPVSNVKVFCLCR